jgi:IS5 family transposase
MDGVRMLGRLVRRARPAVVRQLARVRDAFRTRTRSARRYLQRIHRLARRKDEAARTAQRTAYAPLCQVARQVVRQAERVQQVLAASRSARQRLPHRVVDDLRRVLPLVERVIAQAERRVWRGEQVPADDKVVSLVESHSAILTRHKPGHPVEFGRKVWLGEVDGGIVSDVRVLTGAPPDAPEVRPTLARHQRQFGRAPDLLTGDRGCSTAAVRRVTKTALKPSSSRCLRRVQARRFHGWQRNSGTNIV